MQEMRMELAVYVYLKPLKKNAKPTSKPSVLYYSMDV